MKRLASAIAWKLQMPIDTLELPKHDGGEMIGRWWQIGYEVRNDDDDDDDDDDAIKWWLRKWCLW